MSAARLTPPMVVRVVNFSFGAAPRYESDKTREVVEKMITAHGGLERWRAAPAISLH